MAGHSQFKNIMHRKNAQDVKKARVFSKIAREIYVCVKAGGSDPESNARLRAALLNARAENMPKDNIERAIKKAASNDVGADYSTIRYEGYGVGGVAIIVEALTDNKNRTASDVRSIFTKYSGSLGESNSVAFQFDKVFCIQYDINVADKEKMFDGVLESGADDLKNFDDMYEIYCNIDDSSTVRDNLIKIFGQPKNAKIVWLPQNELEVSLENAKTLFKMIDALEDLDDVQFVVSNMSVSDEIAGMLE